MFSIQLLHKSGGSKSIRGTTIQECKDNAAKFLDKHSSEYVASTVPYAVYVAKGWKNVYDVSIPFGIKQWMGTELRLLYSGEQEE